MENKQPTSIDNFWKHGEQRKIRGFREMDKNSQRIKYLESVERKILDCSIFFSFYAIDIHIQGTKIMDKRDKSIHEVDDIVIG